MCTLCLRRFHWVWAAAYPSVEWLAITNADRDGNELLDRDDVDAALAAVSGYITEDSEAGQAVYRFAHPLIAQHFAADHQDTTDAQLRCAAVLVEEAARLTRPHNGPPVHTWTDICGVMPRVQASLGLRYCEVIRCSPSISRQQRLPFRSRRPITAMSRLPWTRLRRR